VRSTNVALRFGAKVYLKGTVISRQLYSNLTKEQGLGVELV